MRSINLDISGYQRQSRLQKPGGVQTVPKGPQNAPLSESGTSAARSLPPPSQILEPISRQGRGGSALRPDWPMKNYIDGHPHEFPIRCTSANQILDLLYWCVVYNMAIRCCICFILEAEEASNQEGSTPFPNVGMQSRAYFIISPKPFSSSWTCSRPPHEKICHISCSCGDGQDNPCHSCTAQAGRLHTCLSPSCLRRRRCHQTPSWSLSLRSAKLLGVVVVYTHLGTTDTMA